jgi:hypothetical protein
MPAGTKVLVTDAGSTPAVTVRVADAVPPAPPSAEATVLVVLFLTPTVVPATHGDRARAAGGQAAGERDAVPAGRRGGGAAARSKAFMGHD